MCQQVITQNFKLSIFRPVIMLAMEIRFSSTSQPARKKIERKQTVMSYTVCIEVVQTAL